MKKKICQYCGYENAINTERCEFCGIELAYQEKNSARASNYSENESWKIPQEEMSYNEISEIDTEEEIVKKEDNEIASVKQHNYKIWIVIIVAFMINPVLGIFLFLIFLKQRIIY